MSYDDFSNHPTQMGEHRHGGWDGWTPREALVNLLRAMDNGDEKISAIAVVFETESGGVGNRVAGKITAHHVVGLFERVKLKLLLVTGSNRDAGV